MAVRAVLVTTVLAACAAVAAGSAAAPAAAAPGAAGAGCRPSIADLGDPFGGGFSYADAVDGGYIAGTAFLPDGSGRAVLWHAGTAVDLGVAGRYDESFAHGVNAAGAVVGELDVHQHGVAPFLWSGGRLRILPGLGGHFGYADAINERGDVAGTASDASGAPHAVVWTDSGRTVHDLGIAPGDDASYGSGINDAGTVAGDTDLGDDERPAVFGPGGPAVLTARGTTLGAAEDVDDHGHLVGISFRPDGTEHATYWRSARARGRDLGVLPGGSFASLVDLDDAGRAVGGGDLGRTPGTTHAIIWPGRGPLRMLRPLSGHTYRDFSVARQLDRHGNAVGASLTRAGQIRATVWRCAAAQAVGPPPGGAGAARPADVAGPATAGPRLDRVTMSRRGPA